MTDSIFSRLIARLFIPERIFYLIEIRAWRDGTMTRHARNYSCYDQEYLRRGSLKIFRKTQGNVVLHHSNGGIIKLVQIPFDSYDVAKSYLESKKSLAKSGDYAIELNLWQVVARTHSDAYITPPNSYESRQAISLERYQPHFPV